jgi:hypothetical protein
MLWAKRAAALNRKIIEIAQQNVNSSFELARSLATARTIAEVVEVEGYLLARTS